MQNVKPVLKVKDITKSFPGVQALKGVDLEVYPGEVHALMGENGAGKSTLMKIVLGIYQPTTGTMHLNGEPYAPKTPNEALHKGISMIHQEISLVPTTSVSENIWIGREKQFGNKVFINKKKQEAATKEILERLGLAISPSALVSSLSIAQMQLVEIARAVSYDSEIIIMDEPTSALTDEEVKKLYDIIRTLSQQGKTVIYISHKFDEIFEICDNATVLRDGQYIATREIGKTNQEELVSLMVGRQMQDMFPKKAVEVGAPVLEVEHLSMGGIVNDVSFTVHRGEILGFAGLLGAGRTEIMETIFGITPKDSGTVRLNGREIEVRNTKQAIENKLAMVTEDRLHTGVIHIQSVRFNESLAFMKTVTHLGFLDKARERRDTDDMARRLAIKMPSMNSEIALLSGGNQQKVVIARWLLTEPDVLILDEPTRGIDVGAKAEIYKLMGELAGQGKAIIMVSSELPEVMGVSDRIMVVREGGISGEFARSEFNSDEIMKCAFGIK
ncbi:sugar ABC transporter ATP-binding protein [Diplocloster hominis]|uniref:sugar ABC transporter ATP-binding protein n=1 Tax=Diplocloster hominis TaxID=3079010 RepID=UPI0031BAE9ED